MNSKFGFMKSDIIFSGVEAYYFKEVEKYFDSLSTESKINYNIFMACTHLGLKLTPAEKRETIDAEITSDSEIPKYEKMTYSIPRTVLMQEEMNLKRLLFLIVIVAKKDQLNVSELQLAWNNPDISRSGNEIMYKHAISGALYLLLQFKVNQLNPDQINEKIFEIYSRKIDGIKLQETNESEEEELVLNIDKLTDVELDI